MNQPISQLIGQSVGWMYSHRGLLSEGYSGNDPGFKKAKVIFLEDMKKSHPDESEEVILQAFTKALGMV